MSKSIILVQEGTGESKDFRHVIPIVPNSTLVFDSNGVPRCVSSDAGYSNFNLLPNLTSVAAGKDPLYVTIGTGTEVVARSTKGGVRLLSQVTSPADNDNVILTGVAGAASFTTLSATKPPTFRARVNLARITLLVFGAGLDENITNPVPSATAGDGAAFYFDPLTEVNTGIAAQTTNWILTQKVAGADTYIDSGVAVVAGIDYDLKIVWGTDLKPLYYINGTLVGTSTVANTADAAIGVNIGGQMNGTPGGLRVDADVREVQVN